MGALTKSQALAVMLLKGDGDKINLKNLTVIRQPHKTMYVTFSTNCPSSALEYLQKALPNYGLNLENAKPIIDLVRSGKIRIGDPFMYKGQCPVFPEPGCTDEDQQIVQDWYCSLKPSGVKVAG
jgi:hypothetical protein